jgi:hypothetical protein
MAAVFALVLAGTGCRAAPRADHSAAAVPPVPPDASQSTAPVVSRAAVSAAEPIHCGIEMRNVSLHVADGVLLHVRALDGEFVGRNAGKPPVFDDPQSYTLRVRAADLAMDGESLTNLLQQARGSSASPVRDVRLTIEGGLLHARGTLHKGVAVPFSMTAAVSVGPDGTMRLHATKLKAAGVPVKGLLDLVGLDVGDVMKMPPGSGVRAAGNDLLLDTAGILPPPRTEGHLERVGVEGDRLTMRMVGPASLPPRPATPPLPTARNYLYFFGGSIRFGKLTMADADMQLIDAHPGDAFDFFPARYQAQLVAGYSRTTRRNGLQVFMPDYAQVRSNGVMLKPSRP